MHPTTFLRIRMYSNRAGGQTTSEKDEQNNQPTRASDSEFDLMLDDSTPPLLGSKHARRRARAQSHTVDVPITQTRDFGREDDARNELNTETHTRRWIEWLVVQKRSK